MKFSMAGASSEKVLEYEAVEGCHTQLSRTMILYPEVGRHSALALHPALERDGLQVAAKVIAPGMVNALKIFGALARVIKADQGAAVRAAVFEGGDRSVIIAGDHHRHPPDNSRTPVAGIGDLILEAEIIPHRAFENPFLFGFWQTLVAIHPVWHARKVTNPTGRRCGTGTGQKGVGHGTLRWYRATRSSVARGGCRSILAQLSSRRTNALPSPRLQAGRRGLGAATSKQGSRR